MIDTSELRNDIRLGLYKPPGWKGDYTDVDYQRKCADLEAEFRLKLETTFGTWRHSKRDRLWRMAIDYGRSGGFEYMIDVYADFAELVIGEQSESVQVAAPPVVSDVAADVADVRPEQAADVPVKARVRPAAVAKRSQGNGQVLRGGTGGEHKGRVGKGRR